MRHWRRWGGQKDGRIKTERGKERDLQLKACPIRAIKKPETEESAEKGSPTHTVQHTHTHKHTLLLLLTPPGSAHTHAHVKSDRSELVKVDPQEVTVIVPVEGSDGAL